MNKKTIVAAAVLTIMAGMNAAAQGYPVMDITNIMRSIDNGIILAQQLQTMRNNLKTSYDQLQQQIKNFESFDFKELNARDPLGSWKSINTYADRMMTYEQNIESIINRKDIKIGNSSYSLGDIFTTPPAETVQNMSMDGLSFVAIDPFERKLTTEEKAAFHQKYGMSYGNYMRINQMGEMLKKKSAEVIGYSGSLQKNLAEDRERLDSISGDLFGGESAVQQQQINNAVLTVMAQDIKTQANLLGNIAGQLAINSSRAQLEKQAMQDEMNINDLGLSDGFIKMLNEMQSSNVYR
jgi:hypothetical protein